MENSEIIIYQSEDGKTKVEVRLEGETVWLTLNQLAELFQRDKSVISRHIKTCLKKVNCQLIQLLQNMQQLPPMEKRTKWTTITLI